MPLLSAVEPRERFIKLLQKNRLSIEVRPAGEHFSGGGGGGYNLIFLSPPGRPVDRVRFIRT